MNYKNSIKIFFIICFLLILIGKSNFAQSITQNLLDREFDHDNDIILIMSNDEEKNEINLIEKNDPKLDYSLGFKSATYTPTEKLDQKINVKIQERTKLLNLFDEPDYVKNNRTYGFIMIEGRRSPEKLDILRNYGVGILGYHPHHSYKVEIPLDKINELNNLSFVHWIGYATNKQKLDKELIDMLNDKSQNKNEIVKIFIGLFINDTNNEFKKILEKNGISIIKYNPKLYTYLAEIPLKLINSTLVNFDFVLFIERSSYGFEDHDQSMASHGVDYIRDDGYDGYGVRIGIVDSGYESAHEDLPNYDLCGDWSEGSPDCTADPTGHGTHTACTFIGRGNADSKYEGVASGVDDITIARVSEDNGSYKEEDIIDGWEWIADVSPTPEVVTSSLGVSGSPCIGTEEASRVIDEAVFNDSVIYVMSAGNNGPNSETIRIPKCAKNVIAVGNVYDYGDGQIDDIESSSSRGPTDDGRQKPDLVAHGTYITSCDEDDLDGYDTRSGTSMAAPHIAGIIASYIDHYPARSGDTSRVKAALLAKALNKGGSISNIGNTYGFGKSDAYIMHWNRDNSDGWVAGTAGSSLNSDGNWASFNITVPSGAGRLTVVLVWHEPPASLGANYAVINDLDLYLDEGADQSGGNTGEYSSTSGVDNVEYISIDNPNEDTYTIKVYAYDIDPTVSPQEWDVGYMIIRGDPTPTTTVTASANDYSVYVNEEFTVTATVEPDSYVASGVYTEINIPSGVSILSMSTTREDGVTMNYGSDDDINLGNIHESDTRSVTWTLEATTTGTKTISTNINSDNGGTDSDSINVTVSLYPDGHSCTSDSQCQSNYCDSDGVGWFDDDHCFSIESTYYENQDHKCEESARSANDDWCDEKRNEDLNTCDKTGVSYKEDTCSDTCVISDKSIFECTDSGCSCSESLCDGQTTGSNIATCSSDQTYFADKCTSTAGGEDRGDNICRSPAFASGCTADTQCNGVEVGTGNCNSTCEYSGEINLYINIKTLKDSYEYNELVNITDPPEENNETNQSESDFIEENINESSNENKRNKSDVFLELEENSVFLPTDEGQKYGRYFDEIINEDGSRTRRAYLNIRNVYEDNKWKRVEDARSLKDKGFHIIYLEKDERYDFEVIDFNWTSIIFKPVINDINELNKNIPIKINKEIKKTVNYNSKEDKDKEENKISFRFDKILGKNFEKVENKNV